MKVGIFYFSRKPGKDRGLVLAEGGISVGYVRCEVLVDAKGLEDALDRANPRTDESVMNTHQLR